jgi:hypothetical protein
MPAPPRNFNAWLIANRDSLHGLTYAEIHARSPFKVKLNTVTCQAKRLGVRAKLQKPGLRGMK